MVSNRPKFFRFVEELEQAVNQAKFGTDPRPLTERDHFDWNEAEDRPRPTITSKAQARKAIAQNNPVRWRRLQHEVKWMRKQMIKLGLNPDDAGLFL